MIRSFSRYFEFVRIEFEYSKSSKREKCVVKSLIKLNENAVFYRNFFFNKNERKSILFKKDYRISLLLFWRCSVLFISYWDSL